MRTMEVIMMEFRKIVYMLRKDINIKTTNRISTEAYKELDKAFPMTEMVLRLCVDNDNKVNIEFAARITMENIRKATQNVQEASHE